MNPLNFHYFLFTPGRWVGAGRITFNNSPELIRFYTRWIIEKDDQGKIHCNQLIEMQETGQKVENRFSIYEVNNNAFKINLQNEGISSATGLGIIDAKSIAWEFHGKGELEGFEVYELQENGDYMLHAEYASTSLLRTIVDARIWRKDEEQ